MILAAAPEPRPNPRPLEPRSGRAAPARRGRAPLRRRGAAGAPALAALRAARRSSRASRVVATALLSGVDGYADALLSVHMAQHMLLLMVAPVLLACGAPVRLALAASPRRARRADRGVLQLAAGARRSHRWGAPAAVCAPDARHLLHGPVRAHAARRRPSTRSSTRRSCWPVSCSSCRSSQPTRCRGHRAPLARLCSLTAGHDRDGRRRCGALLPGLGPIRPLPRNSARAARLGAWRPAAGGRRDVVRRRPRSARCSPLPWWRRRCSSEERRQRRRDLYAVRGQ